MKHNDKSDRQDSAREGLLARREIDEVTGCWCYGGATTSNGYGHIAFGDRVEYAHRLSAMFFLGFDLASSLLVLHRWDQPVCFNPDHLFIGTQADNVRDAVAKGRMSGKKLTADRVAVIKYNSHSVAPSDHSRSI